MGRKGKRDKGEDGSKRNNSNKLNIQSALLAFTLTSNDSGRASQLSEVKRSGINCHALLVLNKVICVACCC